MEYTFGIFDRVKYIKGGWFRRNKTIIHFTDGRTHVQSSHQDVKCKQGDHICITKDLHPWVKVLDVTQKELRKITDNDNKNEFNCLMGNHNYLPMVDKFDVICCHCGDKGLGV